MHKGAGSSAAGDEVGGVGLVAVLHHKYGRVGDVVDERVVPFALLPWQQRAHDHPLRPSRPATHQDLHDEHLLVPARQLAREAVTVPGVPGKVRAVAPSGPDPSPGQERQEPVPVRRVDDVLDRSRRIWPELHAAAPMPFSIVVAWS